jgi:hypothetical protein
MRWVDVCAAWEPTVSECWEHNQQNLGVLTVVDMGLVGLDRLHHSAVEYVHRQIYADTQVN